jgi:hypothetical protein
MKAILELFPKNRNFPDANSTLRVTYGKIKGYKPSDAVLYEPFPILMVLLKNIYPEITNMMFQKINRFI